MTSFYAAIRFAVGDSRRRIFCRSDFYVNDCLSARNSTFDVAHNQIQNKSVPRSDFHGNNYRLRSGIARVKNGRQYRFRFRRDNGRHRNCYRARYYFGAAAL